MTSFNFTKWFFTSFKTLTPSCIGWGNPAKEARSFLTWKPTNFILVVSRNCSKSFCLWKKFNFCAFKYYIYYSLYFWYYSGITRILGGSIFIDFCKSPTKLTSLTNYQFLFNTHINAWYCIPKNPWRNDNPQTLAPRNLNDSTIFKY